MKKRALIIIAAGFFASLLWGKPLVPASWERTPAWGIPPISFKPTVDGKIDQKEMENTAQFSDFFIMSREFPCVKADGVNFFSGHFEDYVYFAWDFNCKEKGEVGSQNAWPTKADQAGRVQICIQPCLNEGDEWVFEFTGNCAGGFADRKVNSKTSERDANWRGKWEFAAQRTPSGWTGELFFPAKDLMQGLGLKSDIPWKVSISFISEGKNPEVYSWSLDAKDGMADVFSDKKGTLRFLNEAVMLKLENCQGKEYEKKCKVTGQVLNNCAKPKSIEILLDIYGRNNQQNKGLLNFYEAWDRLLLTKTQGRLGAQVKAATATQPFESEESILARLNAAYHYVGEKSMVIDLKEKEKKPFEIELDGQWDEYVYNIRIIEKEKAQTIISHVIVTEKLSGFKVALRPYFLKYKKILIEGDIDKLEYREKAEALHCAVIEKNGLVVIKKTEKLSADQKKTFKCFLDADNMLEGEYIVSIRLLDAKGMALATAEIPLTRPPDPIWWTEGQKLGKSGQVPHPWHPVEANAKEARVLLRTIQFSDQSLLPSQIICRGKPLLEKPINIKVNTENGAEVLSHLGKVVIENNKDGSATYTQSGKIGGNLTCDFRLVVDYDGMMRYDLSISPVNAPVTVKGLSLEIPILKSNAELFVCGSQFTRKDLSNANINPLGGNIEDLFKRFPKGKLPFCRSVFLGKDDLGLQWFAENDKNWANKNDEEVIEIKKDRGAVSMIVNLVDTPLQIEKKECFTWGLIPTPVKDVTKHHFAIKPTSVGDPAMILREAEKNKHRVTWDPFTNHFFNSALVGGSKPFGSIRPSDPEWVQQLKKVVELFKESKTTVRIYTGWGVNKNECDFQSFGYEMLHEPVTDAGFDCFWHNNNSTFPEFVLHGAKQLILNTGINGFHFDSTFVTPLSENTLDGYGWIDKQGYAHGSYPIFATRDFAKRLYTLVRAELGLAESEIDFHACGGSDFYVASFCDYVVNGEAEYSRGKCLEDINPPARFRALYGTWRNGVDSVYHWPRWMWENTKSLPVSPNAMRAITLPHDVQIESYLGSGLASKSNPYSTGNDAHVKLVALREKFRVQDAQFFGYYEKHGLASMDGDCLISIFLYPGRECLLIIGNYHTDPVIDGVVRLDLKKMGFTGKTCAFDALQGNEIAVHENQFKINIYQQRYRLIWVGIDPGQWAKYEIPSMPPSEDEKHLSADGLPVNQKKQPQVEPECVLSKDEFTTFLIHFENGLMADYARGEKAPLIGAAPVWSGGIKGNGVYLCMENLPGQMQPFWNLTYRGGPNVPRPEGTIEFYLKILPGFLSNKRVKTLLTLSNAVYGPKSKIQSFIMINMHTNRISSVFVNPENNKQSLDIGTKNIRVDENSWHHISLCWKGAKKALYFDDGLIGSAEFLPEGMFTVREIRIGHGDKADIADVIIDDLRISSVSRFSLE